MNTKRETVGSRWGFIMLAAGCAIGLGNVWRFPAMAGSSGGGLFVLMYLLFLVLVGLPVMTMELAIGRASRRNLYGAFRDLPEKRPSRWRFPALAMFSGNLILMIMYTTVTGWMLSYFVDFLTGDMTGLTSQDRLLGKFLALLNDPARMSIYMLIVVALGSVVCACGLRNGVERVTKFLMAGLFLILFGLSIYALTLPGAGAGMKFYLLPNLDGANYFKVVSGALSQAFFTLSLGVGALEIFGSYIGRENSLAKESLVIICCDTLVALLAGVVVFSGCFSYGIGVDSGPGLVLISLSSVFNHLPGGRVLGALFFLFLTIASLTTVITVFENLTAFMIDEWHFVRKKAALVNGLTVGLLSFPCLLGFNLWKDVHPLGGNSTILDFEDWLVSDLCLSLGSVAIVIFCCWGVGWKWKDYLAEVNTGKGWKISPTFKWYLAWVLPILIIYLFCMGIYDRFIK